GSEPRPKGADFDGIMYARISMQAPSRRRLLQIMLAAQGAQLASAQRQPFRSLSSSDAAEIEALTAQIIPSTDSPGAREAHVVYFIDQALATFDRHKRDVYANGLPAVQEKRRELFPGSQSIAALNPDQQISLLGAIEKTPFFETLRTHTVMGFLANPEYGGNRNQTGWKHIGFQSSHHFAPPFGYYDQEENQ
ncbi:MAG: gluconate 2-dehydrogenase subunit 3 family protein, partial [Bryobacteraceae bacterium]